MEPSPHQQRVILEKFELDNKLEKLIDFLERNPQYLSLPQDQQLLLARQRAAMEKYSEILGERIATF